MLVREEILSFIFFVFGWDKGIVEEVKDRPSSILNCGKYFKVDFLSYEISNCRNLDAVLD